MSAYGEFAAVVCVLAIAAGQLLFKRTALAYNEAGTLLDPGVLAVLALAAVLYFGATAVWLWVLRFVPLSRAYPWFALSFVLVPLASAYAFGESITARYAMGTALIVLGVALTASSGR